MFASISFCVVLLGSTRSGTVTTTTVSTANLMMVLELNMATQSCVYKEYSKGLRTQSWGDPVFRVRGLEMFLPILTTWGVVVRKSRIQAHRGVFSSSSISLPASHVGTMVLKTELKSINNILT